MIASRLRELDQQAHKGPWVYDSYAAILSRQMMEDEDCDDAVICRLHTGSARNGPSTRPQDAELIAALRNALPALANVVEAAEAVVNVTEDEEGKRWISCHPSRVPDLHAALAELSEALDPRP